MKEFLKSFAVLVGCLSCEVVWAEEIITRVKSFDKGLFVVVFLIALSNLFFIFRKKHPKMSDSSFYEFDLTLMVLCSTIFAGIVIYFLCETFSYFFYDVLYYETVFKTVILIIIACIFPLLLILVYVLIVAFWMKVFDGKNVKSNYF